MDPVVHFEMPAKDKKRMKSFYTKAFGWKTIQYGEDMGNYIIAQTGKTDKKGMLKTKGMINGGFYERSRKDTWRQNPSFVISVKDLDKATAKVKKAGGKIHGKPMMIPGVGMFISFADTEGNKLSMLEAEM